MTMPILIPEIVRDSWIAAQLTPVFPVLRGHVFAAQGCYVGRPSCKNYDGSWKRLNIVILWLHRCKAILVTPYVYPRKQTTVLNLATWNNIAKARLYTTTQVRHLLRGLVFSW